MLAVNGLQVLAAFAIAASACWMLLRSAGRGGPHLAAPPAADDNPVFLFEGPDLVDATPRGMRLLRGAPRRQTELETVIASLSTQFDGLRATLERLTDGQSADLPSVRAPDLSLRLERHADRLRLGVVQDRPRRRANDIPGVELAAMEDEITALRELTRNAPSLIWREDETGNLTWANRAYLQAADLRNPDGSPAQDAWPENPLFPDLQEMELHPDRPLSKRLSLRLYGREGENWFDVTRLHGRNEVLNYATDASAAVRAERTQQAFMQTLGKTFAHLSVGLAVFDAERKLTTFNPAVVEMTGLPVPFLSARPSIGMVLDKLRESRKLPEPRDYSSFREQFSALEAAAQQGSYSEHWSLPEGQTLKVTGHPHPNGGLAFVFEDVSAEISLTRRFRTEIETGQATLDALPDAIAVFSEAQTLVLSNTAYDRLWGEGELQVSPRQDLRQALRLWKAGCAPDNAWKRIEEFANRPTERRPFTKDVALTDGRQMRCGIRAMPSGALMVRFEARTDGRNLAALPRGGSERGRTATR